MNALNRETVLIRITALWRRLVDSLLGYEYRFLLGIIGGMCANTSYDYDEKD